MFRLGAAIFGTIFILLVVPLQSQEQVRAHVAALPIYAAATAKRFGLFEPIALSPDGTKVAYTSCDDRHARIGALAGKAPFEAAGCDIEMISVRSGLKTTIVSGGDNGFPAWSPDGRYLAFMSDRAGENQLYVWDEKTRSTHRVLEAPMQTFTRPMWASDSKTVLVSLAKHPSSPGQGSANVIVAGPLVKGAAVTVYRSAENVTANEAAQAKQVTTASPLLSLDPLKGEVATVDVTTGMLRVALHDAAILSCVIAPDGLYGACGTPVGFSSDNSQTMLGNVIVVNLADGSVRTIAKREQMSFYFTLSWSPDSKFLAWSGSQHALAAISVYDVRNDRVAVATFGTSSIGDIAPHSDIAWIAKSGAFQVIPADRGSSALPITNAIWAGDASGGTMHKLIAIPGQHIEDIFSSVDGRVLMKASELSDYASTWYSFNATTRTYKRLYRIQAAMTSPAFSSNRSLMAYYQQSASEPWDIWITPTNGFSPKRVTHLNPFFDNYVLGKARLIAWRTADGQTLRGALMLPSDYVPGRRYPLVAYPYGSSYKSRDINNFGFGEDAENTEDLQTLATRGIAVFLPDAPVHTGTPMWDIAKTIMPGIDRAIALGYADPNRLGVMGHSYGGYTVMSLIVQTNRFRAAVSRAGFSDWTAAYSELMPDGTAYGLTQADGNQYGLGGDPWKVRDRFISQSPYYRFDRVTTPVLIIHGANDTAVVPFLADMSFVALRHLHKDVAYARYASVGHTEGSWPFADQLDYMTRIVNWFDRYLCPHRKSDTEC